LQASEAQESGVQASRAADRERLVAAVQEAGAHALKFFVQQFKHWTKGAGDSPVTEADIAANEILQHRLLASGDGWLSEESENDPTRLDAGRVWVVDPIDGTREFIEGVPQFAVSIAFVVDGVPKVSVIFNPAKNRFYKAAAGQGAFLNDAAIRVTPRNDIDGALLLVSRSEPQKKFQVFVDRCEIKPVGSIAYRLAKVAGGDGDATITFRTIHEWDICAGVLMVQEAGGTVVDGSGATMIFNREMPKHRGVVAAVGSLAGGLQGMWARAMGDK